MSVDTTVDWQAVKQEIEKFFGIPDGLTNSGIFAIRAMIFRRYGGESRLLIDIAHGEVGLIGDRLESFVDDGFRTIHPEQIIGIGIDGHPGNGLVTKEMRGDLVVIEYLDVEGAEKDAEKFIGAMLMLLGNYANRNL